MYKRTMDKHSKLHYACSKPVDRSAQFQMGGTITGVLGQWAGRDTCMKLAYLLNDFGRWNILHLKGKRTSRILVITIYRVSKQSNTGKHTIWIQHHALIYFKCKHINCQFILTSASFIPYFQPIQLCRIM